ncbi:MAG: hypothetical protein RLZZ210_1083 [Pseudomonadota bacterium]|jgi:hypothetical protein
MSNNVKVVFPNTNQKAHIPIDKSAMKAFKSEVKGGSTFGFSMSKSGFLNSDSCPINGGNELITSWIYPQFELMNFYAIKQRTGNISTDRYIHYAKRALTSYQTAKNAYTPQSVEQNFMTSMSDVLKSQILQSGGYVEPEVKKENIHPDNNPHLKFVGEEYGLRYYENHDPKLDMGRVLIEAYDRFGQRAFNDSCYG